MNRSPETYLNSWVSPRDSIGPILSSAVAQEPEFGSVKGLLSYGAVFSCVLSVVF